MTSGRADIQLSTLDTSHIDIYLLLHSSLLSSAPITVFGIVQQKKNKKQKNIIR